MDFMNRGNRPVQQHAQATHPVDGGAVTPRPATKQNKFKDSSKLAKVGYLVFLAAIAVLIIAVVLSMTLSKDGKSSESGYVNKDRFQAVFLNGGQVYFGKINDLNSQYLSMNNIYYLRVNQQVQPNQSTTATNSNDISLVKLGCELHGPDDSMVINREQIIFWENLKTDGQVAKAVDEYVKANPSGQKCETTTGASTGTGTGTTTGTGTSTTTGTGTTTTPTTTTTPSTTTTKKP